MIDFIKIKNDYVTYKKYQKKCKDSKLQTHEFYMTHLYEIETSIDEYYESADDKEKCQELFKVCTSIKTFLSLQTISNQYKQIRNKYVISPELEKLGKSVIYICPNSFTIYDVENNKTYNFELDELNVIKYIEFGLTKLNKFIAQISENELNVIKVIYQDITSDIKLSKLPDKEICNRIFNELIRARMFEDSYMFYTSENQVMSKEEEFKKIIKDYNDKKITKKEYYIKFYYVLILCDQNITELYINADDEHKEYIIDAYLMLSEYHYDNKAIRIRSTSEIVNEAILERRKKAGAK